MWKEWLERTLNRRHEPPAPTPAPEPLDIMFLSHALTGEVALMLMAVDADLPEEARERAEAQ